MKKSYYIYTNGTLLRKDNTIQFVSAEGTKRDLPIERITDIYVMSEININSALLNFVGSKGVSLHFFNYYSYYTGSFCPRESLLAGELLVKQVSHYVDPEKRLCLARSFVDTATSNIYRNLRYYNGRGKDLFEHMRNIESLKRDLTHARSIHELMGYEGNIRRTYYNAWPIIINKKLDFDTRTYNPPHNEINTLISFVNSLVYTRVLSEIYHTQLNPTISFLHEPGTRRFSLCLDLAEIFKPLLGDRLIFTLLNRNQISEKSFTKELNYLHLTKEASKIITQALDERLQTTIQHPTLNRQVSYQYLIRLEVYKLIKHIIAKQEYEGFTIWW